MKDKNENNQIFEKAKLFETYDRSFAKNIIKAAMTSEKSTRMASEIAKKSQAESSDLENYILKKIGAKVA